MNSYEPNNYDNQEITLESVWKKIEELGFTAVHAYRDSQDTTKWYSQLLHPDQGRLVGMGISYVNALQDALYEFKDSHHE